MNPLAQELNDQLNRENSFVYEMLSHRGKELFFPKGILSQSAEAKVKAKRFNATIGIATEGGVAMHLQCIREHLAGIAPDEAFTYAPVAGKPELRKRWQEKLLSENPSLKGKHFSQPMVTSAITHGLGLVGDLFVDEGDVIFLPDKLWGNYRLIFATRLGAELRTFPFYNRENTFNTDGFKQGLQEAASHHGKIIVLFNFPNNPTGYSISPQEADALCRILKDVSSSGVKLVVVSDDAYFGLFYDEAVLKESLFARIANLDERILAIKLDGATKEQFVWGFRVGFITFAAGGSGNSDVIYDALSKKTMGAIRGGISNCSHLSQTLVLKALESSSFAEEKRKKFEVIKARALRVQEVLNRGTYDDAWTYYPFNSGYFMCLKLKAVDAEDLRQHILEKYGVGVISVGDADIRVAFSCTEVADIQELFDLIYRGVKDLS